MPGQLQAVSNATLGFLGLNTQEAGVTLDSGYATKAINCIIDKSGRLGSRRGWSMLTTTPGDLGTTATIDSMFEFLDEDRISTIFSAGNGKLYTGTTTLTTTPIYDVESAGVSAELATQPTYTTNRWQFAQLADGTGVGGNMHGFAAQNGAAMLVYRRENDVGSYKWQTLGTAGYGAVPTGVTTCDPDTVLSAYGRIWIAGITGAESQIFYSQLLDGTAFTGTGSGTLNVAAVVGNNDEVVGLASHNGFLIVFCKHNIVIYQNADDPTNIALQDVITGVGCIARDTIQTTGNDLIFLSDAGLMSLKRIITEKSLPMRELSLNIRDDLISYIAGEDKSTIRSIYYERDGFYLLVLPGLKDIIYFDLRKLLENGSARTTIWSGLTPKALLETEDNTLYYGEAGGIARYTGYTDDGEGYRMEYFTQNTDIGAPNRLKILKKTKAILIASGTQDIVFKYGFDYNTVFESRTYTKDFTGGSSEYNLAEYNINEFTAGTAINELQLNIGGSGKFLQFGVEVPIEGAPVAIQQLTVYFKMGRVN